MTSYITQQWHFFKVALMFYSRVPVRGISCFNEDDLVPASAYLPWVGILIGLWTIGITLGLLLFLPATIACLAGLMAAVMFTGAFHEDGLADMLDGFGGGWEKLQILDIMKDSRVGSFGAIGLWFLLSFRWMLMWEVLSSNGTLLFSVYLLSSFIFARTCVLFILWRMQYVREDQASKVKPIASGVSFKHIRIGLIPGVVLLLICPGLIIPVIGGALVTLFLMRKFKRVLGGYTGDCLGAAEQILEVTCLTCCLLL